MNQLERNKSILEKYIPLAAVDIIAQWIFTFDFKFKIKRGRSSKYGDYRPPIKGLNHQITVNQDLNKYAFLITLVHEIAHLTCFNKFKERAAPHGEEWKNEYKQLMKHFLHEGVFPADVILALQAYMSDPAASSCSDLRLQRVLKKHDTIPKGIHLEELPYNSLFKIKGDRYFIKGEKLRKRYKCMEHGTNRFYLFSPVSEVEPASL